MTQSDNLIKLHDVELQILRRFVNLCEKYSIRYYIIGGTLIGAVRHGGFIPWDDDIDIAVPRDDYVKLINIMRNMEDEVMGMEYYRDNPELYFYPVRLINKQYRITEKRSKGGIANPWIDILPIDGLPDGSINRALFKLKMNYYRTLLGLHYVDNLRQVNRSEIQKMIIAVGRVTHIGRLIDPTKVKDRIDNTLSENKMDKCRMSGTCMGAYFFHEFVNTEYFGEGRHVLFEDVEVNAPKQIHPYLTHMYGDYMKLPPEEKRTEHGIEFV